MLVSYIPCLYAASEGVSAVVPVAPIQSEGMKDFLATMVYYIRWMGYISGVVSTLGFAWLFYQGRYSNACNYGFAALGLFNLGNIVNWYSPWMQDP